jgi:uncharacterized membrane protein
VLHGNILYGDLFVSSGIIWIILCLSFYNSGFHLLVFVLVLWFGLYIPTYLPHMEPHDAGNEILIYNAMWVL